MSTQFSTFCVAVVRHSKSITQDACLIYNSVSQRSSREQAELIKQQQQLQPVVERAITTTTALVHLIRSNFLTPPTPQQKVVLDAVVELVRRVGVFLKYTRVLPIPSVTRCHQLFKECLAVVKTTIASINLLLEGNHVSEEHIQLLVQDVRRVKESATSLENAVRFPTAERFYEAARIFVAEVNKLMDDGDQMDMLDVPLEIRLKAACVSMVSAGKSKFQANSWNNVLALVDLQKSCEDLHNVLKDLLSKCTLFRKGGPNLPDPKQFPTPPPSLKSSAALSPPPSIAKGFNSSTSPLQPSASPVFGTRLANRKSVSPVPSQTKINTPAYPQASVSNASTPSVTPSVWSDTNSPNTPLPRHNRNLSSTSTPSTHSPISIVSASQDDDSSLMFTTSMLQDSPQKNNNPDNDFSVTDSINSEDFTSAMQYANPVGPGEDVVTAVTEALCNQYGNFKEEWSRQSFASREKNIKVLSAGLEKSPSDGAISPAKQKVVRKNSVPLLTRAFIPPSDTPAPAQNAGTRDGSVPVNPMIPRAPPPPKKKKWINALNCYRGRPGRVYSVV